MRIPAGVQAGQSIRLAGKGGAGFDGGSAGDPYLRVRYAQHPDRSARGADLYIGIFIEVPPHVTPGQKALWEQLSRESGFNPREET